MKNTRNFCVEKKMLIGSVLASVSQIKQIRMSAAIPRDLMWFLANNKRPTRLGDGKHTTHKLLVGGDWNMAFMTFRILGMSSSQLTNSYFLEGLKPPTSMTF